VASQSFIPEKKNPIRLSNAKRFLNKLSPEQLSPIRTSGMMSQTPHYSRMDSISRASNYDEKSQNISHRYDQKASRKGMRPQNFFFGKK